MRTVPCRLGDQWIDDTPSQTLLTNPSRPEELVAAVPELGVDDVKAAMAYASGAASAWAGTPPVQRARLLSDAADRLEDRRSNLVNDLVAEGGKPVGEATGEFEKSVATLRYYAGLAGALDGRSFPAAEPGTRIHTRREPIGPVVAITPWNVPLASPTRKVAPALLAGNPVIIKPATLTPISAYHLVAAFVDAGAPPGIVQTITGPGSQVGAALIGQRQVAAVSFTGSTEVGLAMRSQLGNDLARLQLELGGKNGAVVLADCDLERAAATIVADAFALAGQQCTSTSRVIVDEAVAADLESRLVARALTIEVGSTSDPSVQMGPLIDTGQVDVVDGFVRRAVREGASIACGGIRLERPGHFYAPTILTGVSPDMEVAREEVFGPVLSVIRVRSASEALDVLNDTPYGLSASIHTTSLATAEMFVSGTDAGVTSVNGPTSGIELPAPFGGFKLSGTSYKEHGPEALDFYTRIKLVRWTA